MITDKQLFELAIKARENAHAPYSNFKVGAALLAKNGEVYLGCNIENMSYPVTLCAERSAFSNAIAAGVKEFEKIAIVGGKDKLVLCSPCGMCRQFMQEFCSKDFKIILGEDVFQLKTFTLEQLLPESFEL